MEKIAVLIPAYNEEVVIRQTIQSLFEAGCKASNIYIADDCSTDNTVSIAESLGVNVASTPSNRGKAGTQRYSLQKFDLLNTYDYVIFMDGDTLVDIDFCANLHLAARRNPEVSLFLGRIKSLKSSNVFSAYRAMEYAYGQDIIKQGQDNFGVIFVAPGCASMYKADTLKLLSIDSDTLAEDMDLTVQVHKLKKRVLYVPEAVVNTQDPATLKDYTKQIDRWYRGFWQIIKKHNIFNLFKNKNKVEIYMIYSALSGLILNKFVVSAVLLTFNSLVQGLILDFLIFGLIALYGAIRNKRFDILLYLPKLYILNHYNFVIFIKSFIEVILMNRTLLSWNKVTRYEI